MKRMSPKKYADAQSAKIRLKKIMPVFLAYCGIIESSVQLRIEGEESEAKFEEAMGRAELKHRDFCEGAIRLGCSASSALRVFDLLIMAFVEDKRREND